MTSNDTGNGLTLFTGAALLLLILWVPVYHVLLPGVNEYFMLSCIWIGLIYTIGMQSYRTTGYPVTLFPVFQGYMALTGYTVLQETGFIISVFMVCSSIQSELGKHPETAFFARSNSCWSTFYR